ncbi:MAG: heavy metal translocating P-type ATPase [Devosia sp.]
MAGLSTVVRYREPALLAVALAGLALGGALWAAGYAWASYVWIAATLPVLAALLVEIVAALRRRDVGLDVVAALSMSAAVGLGEPLAANVVALMYAGGQLLEQFAQGRARGEMTALLGRVARTAMVEHDGVLSETPIEAIVPGDALLIRQGEVLPVDGRVAAGNTAILDPSALTGESLPQHVGPGGSVYSGASASGAAFRMIAGRPAAESTYAAIVRLVANAQQSKAPISRLADRYAMLFLLVTVALAALAWIATGDPQRLVAVLVAATPCPLILGVPVALVSGMSRAASLGVLVKDGSMLEHLAAVRIAILDKTGTLTRGTASLVAIHAAGARSPDEVLRLAASLDQASTHPFAAALIDAARERGLALSSPSQVKERAGEGIHGIVEGMRVELGGEAYIASRTGDDASQLRPEHAVTATVAVAIEGRLVGVLVLDDPLRSDAADLVQALRHAGVARIILASGDRAELAEDTARRVGIETAFGDMSPASKLDLVTRSVREGRTLMVGDGINDAPALAAADVGVAMSARGTVAASESAGVVMLVDNLGALAHAMEVSRRSLVIAGQSVVAGLGLSLLAMVAAAFGFLPPVQGALLQEVIDVAVILNALRALR